MKAVLDKETKNTYRFKIVEDSEGISGTIYVNKAAPTKPQTMNINLLDPTTTEGKEALNVVKAGEENRKAAWAAKKAAWATKKVALATTYEKHFG